MNFLPGNMFAPRFSECNRKIPPKFLHRIHFFSVDVDNRSPSPVYSQETGIPKDRVGLIHSVHIHAYRLGQGPHRGKTVPLMQIFCGNAHYNLVA